MREGIPLFGEQAPLADVRDTVVEGPAGAIPVRVYRPEAGGTPPAIVHFHGGGWVVGDLDTHDSTCRDLAAGSACAVVAVDYRLAPEHPFPAALEDSLAAAAAVGSPRPRPGPRRRGRRQRRRGPGRDRRAGASGRGAPPGADLSVVDARAGVTDSYARYADGCFLTARDMRWFLDHYAAGGDPADPRLSALAAADLAGVAPASIVLAECDPLHDEGVAYARRLEDAGVEVELRDYPGQLHPFVLLAGVIDDGREARAWLARRLGEALH